MESAEKPVDIWFELRKLGRFRELPIAESFRHHSPFGTVDGKHAYLNLVDANKKTSAMLLKSTMQSMGMIMPVSDIQEGRAASAWTLSNGTTCKTRRYQKYMRTTTFVKFGKIES